MELQPLDILADVAALHLPVRLCYKGRGGSEPKIFPFCGPGPPSNTTGEVKFR